MTRSSSATIAEAARLRDLAISRINARIGHIAVDGKPLDARNPIVKRAEPRR